MQHIKTNLITLNCGFMFCFVWFLHETNREVSGFWLLTSVCHP